MRSTRGGRSNGSSHAAGRRSQRRLTSGVLPNLLLTTESVTDSDVLRVLFIAAGAAPAAGSSKATRASGAFHLLSEANCQRAVPKLNHIVRLLPSRETLANVTLRLATLRAVVQRTASGP